MAPQQSRVSCDVAGCKPAQRIRPVRTDTAEACWIDRETRESTVAATLALVAATLAQPKLCTYACRCTVHYICTQEADTAIHIPEGITEAGRAHRLSETRRAEPCRDVLSSRHATKPSHHETNPPSWLRANLGGGGGAVPSSSLDFRSASASVALPARPQHPLSIRPLSQPQLNVLDGS